MKLAIQPGTVENLKAVARKVADLTSQLLSKTPNVPRIAILHNTVTHTTANTPFTVPHPLGVVPDGILQSLSGDSVRMYATEDDQRAWTNESIVVRCASNTSKVELIVFTTQ